MLPNRATHHIFGLFFCNIFLWLYFYNSQNFTVTLHSTLEKRTNLYILIVDVLFNDIIYLETYLSCPIKPFFRRKERNINNLVPRASFCCIRGKQFFKNALGTRLKHSNSEQKELNKKYSLKQKLRLTLY